MYLPVCVGCSAGMGDGWRVLLLLGDDCVLWVSLLGGGEEGKGVEADVANVVVSVDQESPQDVHLCVCVCMYTYVYAYSSYCRTNK